ncbi:hypothetical protein [Streptomyces sp. NPDC101393]|uniref:hypothetical protein n=1 Tax=Streptomyces sp. NPDC101393 TaxID=3366141 RepID=UPI0037F5AF98
MSEQENTTDPAAEAPETPAAAPEAPATETQEPKDTGADVRGTGDGGDELEALKKSLQETRAEAARYRVRAREATEALGATKTADEYAALEAEKDKLSAQLMRVRVAAKYNLPDTLASRLTGATEEELESDAQTLATFTATTPLGRGGLDPNRSAASSSPADLAARIPRARR